MNFIRTLVIFFLVILTLPKFGHAQKILLPLSPVLKAKEPSFFSDSIHLSGFVIQVKEEQVFQQLPLSWKILFRKEGIIILNSTPSEFIRQLSLVKNLLFADEYIKGRRDFPQKIPVAVELVTFKNIQDYIAYGKK